MSRLRAPADNAYSRKVLFAAEVLDGITLTRISDGITVSASVLAQAPVVNGGGVFVWLDHGLPLAPQQVMVDAGLLPYQGASVASPLLPNRLVQIQLAPARAYPFQPGTTALRFSLIESIIGAPVAAPDTEIFLRWFDSGAWLDAPLRSRTDARGDAAVTLRFSRSEEPGKDGAGRLRVRLCARRAGATAMSAEFALPEGQVTAIAPPFALNTFLP